MLCQEGLAVSAVPSSGAEVYQGNNIVRWTINELMGIKLEVNNDL